MKTKCARCRKTMPREEWDLHDCLPTKPKPGESFEEFKARIEEADRVDEEVRRAELAAGWDPNP